MARFFSNWRRYRETVSEPSSMNACGLQDLCTSRADIGSLIRQSAAR
jgi:uncharacterized protein YjiS (DUF1127 family)